jgi:hypothetical protein
MPKGRDTRRTSITYLGLLVLGLGACTEHSTAQVTPGAGELLNMEIPVVENDDLDLLFVIDNSGSMKEEQASLAAAFPHFIDLLPRIRGTLPSLHIGVVSTDVGAGAATLGSCTGDGDDGQLKTSGCAGIDGAFLSDVALPTGARDRNYTGDLAAQFACTAQVGTSGCGAEQPLEAMRRALDPVANRNPGFLRPDAYLAVMIISDEDDCSVKDRAMFDLPGSPARKVFGCTAHGLTCAEPDLTTPGAKHACVPDDASPYLTRVDAFADFLIDLKGAGNLAVAAITGDPDPVAITLDAGGDPELAPSCTSASGTAAPAVRTRAFVDRFGSAGSTAPICGATFDDAFASLASIIKITLAVPCLNGAIADTDPAAAGVQPDCVVSELIDRGKPTATETPLPACDATQSQLPCWHLTTDATFCGDAPDHLRLVVERGPTHVPHNSIVRMQCVRP